MAVGDAYVFPGFLTPVLTQLFFPKPPTTFLTSFCRGERQKYARKRSCLNRGSNSQPPGHEYDTLTTEPPGRGHSQIYCLKRSVVLQFIFYHMTKFQTMPSPNRNNLLTKYYICMKKNGGGGRETWLPAMFSFFHHVFDSRLSEISNKSGLIAKGELKAFERQH